MPKGRGNGKGAPGKRTGTPRSMNKPAMMDWALRLLRLLNERKVLNSRIVAEEFDVNIRTAQRYLLYLSDLPCVVVDEEKHTYTLTSDYVITDKILNTSPERPSSPLTSTTTWTSASILLGGCRTFGCWNRRGTGIISGEWPRRWRQETKISRYDAAEGQMRGGIQILIVSRTGVYEIGGSSSDPLVRFLKRAHLLG